ncbi:type II toxin-antitoxin system HicA family toxin [Propionivibrio sp.]|uniref:type II toxin-antitoxin system HicA family toxin n=1 Tax=Propionivibrio sp. TaxID=2212460 RepID=UPI003436B73B
MSDKLPRVSGAAVIRALERLGFEKARQSGSHVIMRRGSKGCVVPLQSGIKYWRCGRLEQSRSAPRRFLYRAR